MIKHGPLQTMTHIAQALSFALVAPWILCLRLVFYVLSATSQQQSWQ